MRNKGGKMNKTEIERRKKICEACKFYNPDTKECDLGRGYPKIRYPWLYYSYCEYWKQKRR